MGYLSCSPCMSTLLSLSINCLVVMLILDMSTDAILGTGKENADVIVYTMETMSTSTDT